MSRRVIIATPYWHLNGVNTVSASLIRGLRAAGTPAGILLTDHRRGHASAFPPPADIEFARLPRRWRFRRHLYDVAAHLAGHAPCVYLPGYDFMHSGIAPVLPDSVITVGVVHSDDPLHYDHVRRLGRYWNAVVCVSRAIERKVAADFPELASRTLTIHNGVDLPAPTATPPRPTVLPIEVVYAGRVEQEQKRIRDIPVLLDALAALGTQARLTIIGGGSLLGELRERTRPHAAAGRVRILGAVANDEVLRTFAQSDVFLLTSDYEGLPISMLEAMVRGCIPVVTDIPSGIPEVIEPGRNGWTLPVGDMAAFARQIDILARDNGLRERTRDAARATVLERGFNTPHMAAAYAALFDRLADDVAAGRFQRPRGPIVMPWRPSLLDHLRRLTGNPLQRLRRLRR